MSLIWACMRVTACCAASIAMVAPSPEWWRGTVKRSLANGPFRLRPLDAPCRALILNRMVYYQPASLDRTFAALADPTRRALLARRSERDAVSGSDLAKPFAMSLPAILKHLDVLKDAGLVTREKSGRIVSCRLRAEPMHEANEWLNRYQRFWTERLDQLEALLENDAWLPPSPPNQASPSSGEDARRRRASSPPGRSRRS